MKTKLLSGIAIISLMMLTTFSSCNKEDSDCETYKYGTITVSNSSSNPYNIYIDDVFKMELSGGSISTEIEIDEGNSRKLYAEQVSGYILYPTTREEFFNVVRCSDYSWQIP